MARQRDTHPRWLENPLMIIWTIIVFGLAGCGGDNSNNPAGPDPDPDPDGNSDVNLIQVFGNHDDLSQLSQAITNADLEDSLKTEGPFTVLAPVNSAFDNLPEGFIDGLSQEQLKTLIKYHLVPSEMSSSELGEQDTIQTVQEDPIFVRNSGTEIEFNRGPLHGGSTITEADIEAANGVIHKINEVLVPDIFLDVLAIADKRYNLTKFVCSCTTGETGLQPILEDPDAEFTVFVPTDDAFEGSNIDTLPSEDLKDLLEYHIVEERILSGDLSDGQSIVTRNGAELTVTIDEDGTISLNNGAATVQEADLEGINGVVYIIDTVLSPPDS